MISEATPSIYRKIIFCDRVPLSIHLSRKHGNIEQLDGHNDSSFSDEKYDSSRHYWETGRLGKRYQTYLDASEIIDKSDISEDDKFIEKEKLLNARKSAFIQDKQNFKYFPPWNLPKHLPQGDQHTSTIADR